ncbi:hypothetical protein MTO96_043789, partial [Rhipicephalus appendiculatus]
KQATCETVGGYCLQKCPWFKTHKTNFSCIGLLKCCVSTKQRLSHLR